MLVTMLVKHRHAMRMFFASLLLALFAAAAPPSPPAVVAYIFPQNRALAANEIAAGKLTRINFAFAALAGGVIVNGSAYDEQNLATLVGLKRAHPGLTVLASVGGWLGSGGFSDMALTRQRRAKFIASVARYIERHDLDGIDIDWEYPALPGATNHFRPADKQNYTRLLRELRRRLDREQKRLHRRLYLTVATGGAPKFVTHTQMGAVARYVDTVNLMAYDYYEPQDDHVTGNHAPLYTDPRDPKGLSADRSVREYLAAGVPAAKLVLGVPFYAHAWGGVPDVHHGLFEPGHAVKTAYGQYDDVAALLRQGFTRYWDRAAAVPHLYSPSQKIFVSYEDAESLAGKCRYVLAHHLGGVMFWAYADTPTGLSLLDAVNAGLKPARPAMEPAHVQKSNR